MRALTKLFGRSPFAPLRLQMEKVVACVHLVPDLFEAVASNDQEKVAKIARKISKAEHDADLTKNDIRTSMKSHLFLPVDRGSLLDVLSIQDNIADAAENIAVLCTMIPLTVPSSLNDLFNTFLKQNIQTVDESALVVQEIHELLETSFGGSEATKVRTMVDHIAYLEHEVDLIQRELMRGLFQEASSIPHQEFYLWMRLIEEIAELSNLAEKLGNRILMTMELK